MKNLFTSLPREFSDLHPIRLAGRKSDGQPHTWLLCSKKTPKFVIKFSQGGGQSAMLIKRETKFYSGISPLQSGHYIAEHIPRLVSKGSSAFGPYFILEYSSLTPPGRWIPRMLRWSDGFVTRWQNNMLDWLFSFQGDPVIRETFSVPNEKVMGHGDFNHFNILGNKTRFKVIDWENWTVTEYPFLDALHLLVVPTFGAGSPNSKLNSFKSFWIRDSSYRRNAMKSLSPFLKDLNWQEAMAIYLNHQTIINSEHAPDISKVFQFCQESWSHYHQSR